MNNKNLFVVFRYDDYTGTSPIGVEKKLFEIFNRAGAGISVGVVPLVTSGDYHVREICQFVELSDEKIQLLNEYVLIGTVDVVLHGFNHNNCSVDMVPTEFRHLDYDIQFHKIKNGKEILEKMFDCQVSSFIPPWNTYDANTLLCLKNNGIKCISANRYGSSIDDRDLKYLPITIEFKDLDSAIAAARSSNAENKIISVLLHPYDFISSGDDRGSIDWSDLDEKLTLLKCFHDVEILTIEGCLNSCNIDLGYARYKFNAPGYLENIFPPFIKTTYNEHVYRDKKSASNLRRLKEIKATSFYLLLAIFIFIFTKLMGLKLNIDGNYSNYFILSIICISFLLIYSAVKKRVYFKKFLFFYCTLIILFSLKI